MLLHPSRRTLRHSAFACAFLVHSIAAYPAVAADTPTARTLVDHGTWLPVTPPPPRWGAAGVYDPVADALLVMGGFEGVGPARNNVWRFSLDGSGQWTELVTTGTSPSSRTDHTLVHDAPRNRVVMFAGNTHPENNDTWTLTLSPPHTWVRLTPSAVPLPRESHCAIYDPVRQRMLVFGGYVYDQSVPSLRLTNEVWVLSLSGSASAPWEKLTPAGTPPPARRYAAAVYDPVRDRMLVFGGWSDEAFSFYNDVWALSLSPVLQWELVTTTGIPPIPQSNAGMVYDAPRDRLVIRPGITDPDPESPVMWSLSLSGTPTWSELAPTGESPAARQDAVTVFDPVREQMMVFGGRDPNVPDSLASQNRVHWLSLNGPPHWDGTAPVKRPYYRTGQTGTRDPMGDRMIVFGGHPAGPSAARLNDLWELPLGSLDDWQPLAATGTPPSPRQNHTAVYDGVGRRMIVFGGDGGASRLNDVWQLSLAGTPEWLPIAPAGTPPVPRENHVAVWDAPRERMIVVGGRSGSTWFTDVWELTFTPAPAWNRLLPTGVGPGPLVILSGTLDPVRNQMIVYHGGPGLPDSLFALSLDGPPHWTLLKTSIVSSILTSQDGGTFYDPRRDRVVIPAVGYGPLQRMYTYDFGTATASLLEPLGPTPYGRPGETLIYDPLRDRAVLFAGSARNDVYTLTFSGVVGVPSREAGALHLGAPHPNPARAGLTIPFALERAGDVRLRVYDLAGRVVATLVNGWRPAGPDQVVWDARTARGTQIAAGIYLVELRHGAMRESRRVAVLP